MEKASKKMLKINIAIQINGKTRDIVEIDDGVTKEIVFEMIKSNKKIAKYLGDKKIKKEIYVPGKIVNFVI